MEMHIFGVLYTVLFVILCVMFIGTFSEKRDLSGKWCRYAVIGAMILADYFISVKLDGDIILKEIAIIVTGTLFMCLCFRQRWIKTAIFVLLYQGICFVTDYISIIMLSKCFPTITMERLSEPLINAMLGILSQMLQVCFIMVLRRYVVKKSSEMLTTLEWVRFTIFPIYTIIVLIALLTNFEIPESDHQKNILICIAFGLLVMNIIVFCLINDILKREVQITENRLLLERVKNETGMYRTISENYDKQKKREHEYKNQLALIAALASENRVDEINHYLKQYNHEIMQHTDFIDTNNVIVNAILNSKYQETREKGIVFVVKVNDLSDLRIKDEDIVLILSNLLNNAIEACEQCEKPIIKMKFVKEEHQIVLSVANTFSVTPVIVGKRYITTKTKEADRHEDWFYTSLTAGETYFVDLRNVGRRDWYIELYYLGEDLDSSYFYSTNPEYNSVYKGAAEKYFYFTAKDTGKFYIRICSGNDWVDSMYYFFYVGPAIQTFDIVDMPTYGGVNLFGTAYQTYTCDLRNAFPSTTAIININLSDSFSKGTCSHLSKYMSAGGRTYYNTPGDNAIKGITNASIGQLWTFGAKCSQNTHSGVHWSGRINGKFKCIMEPYPGNELDF